MFFPISMTQIFIEYESPENCQNKKMVSVYKRKMPLSKQFYM